MTTRLSSIFKFLIKKRKPIIFPVLEEDREYTEKEYMIEVRHKVRQMNLYIITEIEHCMRLLELYKNGTYKESYDRLNRSTKIYGMIPDSRRALHMRLFIKVHLGTIAINECDS